MPTTNGDLISPLQQFARIMEDTVGMTIVQVYLGARTSGGDPIPQGINAYSAVLKRDIRSIYATLPRREPMVLILLSFVT